MAAIDRWRDRFRALTPGLRLLVLLVVNLGLIVAFNIAARPYARDTGPSIVNLQLSFSAGVFTQIIGLWQAQDPGVLTRVWWTVVSLDTIFPIAYAAFLSQLYVWLRTSAGQPPGSNVRVMPWIAAGFDYLENAILLWLLWRFPDVSGGAVAIMSAAAATKFAFLTITIACSAAALLGDDRGRVLRTARYSVISLLVATVPLIYLPQGRDLLVSLADSAAGAYPVSFLAWLTVWAFSVWYWSRVLLEAECGPAPSPLFTKWARWTPRVAGALTLLLPGIAFLLATERTVVDAAMQRLGLICIVMGAVFLYFTIRRREWIKDTGRPSISGYSPDQLPSGTVTVLIVSAIASLALFFWLVLDPLWSGPALGSVSVLVIAAANTVFIGSVVAFIGRWRKVPLEAVALVCAAVFSLWNDNHDVRLLTTAPLPARPTLSQTFDTWIAPLAGPSSLSAVPVILVAAEGGGIRAAYWAATVLAELDRQLPQSFRRHVFAVSSVSGGSMGAAVYAALQRDVAQADHLDHARRVMSAGFLAPIAARLVTGDFLQWFIPFPIQAMDRSRAMEASWEAAYARVTGKPTFAEGFLALNHGTGIVPLLFVNATSVDTGRRVVTSPVIWSPPDEGRRPDLVDMHALVGDDLRLSTVVHNSARFAYISPAGRVRTRDGADRGHVVDGGYFENTGADTLADVVGALRAARGSRAVRFVALILRNTPVPERMPSEAAASWQETRQLGEAFAPIRAVLRSREARGELAVRRLRDDLGADVLDFEVCADKPGEAEPPLGWELSREMIARLDGQLAGCISSPLGRLREILK